MRVHNIHRGQSGPWVRRGSSIVLLSDDSANGSGEMEFETGPIPATQQGVIHPAIDVHAQHALMRMSRGDAGAQADAWGMLQAVRRGALGGIFQVDQAVPALRARAMGRGWWQLVPAGHGAALVPDPAGQGAPIIAFAQGLAARLPELETVLRRAWEQFVRIYNLLPNHRLRLSVWAPHEFVTAANLAGAKGLLDDVSLLRTMTFDPDRPALTLVRDPLGPAEAEYPRMASRCHDLGIQALAGFAIVPEGAHKAREDRIADQFNRWLRAKEPEARFAAVARQMADRARGYGFDGISVDVESLACDVGPRFTLFCHALAAELAKQHMWLAVAVTPKHDGLTRVPCMSRALEFGMARGASNLVIRPMGYAKEGKLSEERHAAILNHALVTHKAPASGVQLGLQNIPGSAGSLDTGEIASRCRRVLRPRNVGLVLFHLRKRENWADWREYERALNQDLAPQPSAPPPRTAGQPLQAPLDAEAGERIGLPSAGTTVAAPRALRGRPLARVR